MTPSVRLSIYAHATHKVRASLPLGFPFARSNLDRIPQSGTRGLCAVKDSDCSPGSVVVLSGFWLAGWQDPARGGSGRAERGSRSSTVAWEAGQLRPELGLGTLAWGHWSGDAGPTAAGNAGPHWGRGSAHVSGALQPMFLPDPHLTALAWTC